MDSCYLFFRCWTEPRHWNLPFTIMAIRVHRASHSSILYSKQNYSRILTNWVLKESEPNIHSFAFISVLTHAFFRKNFIFWSYWTYQFKFAHTHGTEYLNNISCVSLPGCLVLKYLCEVRTTARPSLITLRIQFQRKRLAFGSIPVVGSSWETQRKNTSSHIARSLWRFNQMIKTSVI